MSADDGWQEDVRCAETIRFATSDTQPYEEANTSFAASHPTGSIHHRRSLVSFLDGVAP